MIKLSKSQMKILLACKHGDVNKTILNIVFGRDDVEYDDKNLTIISWLNCTIEEIKKQDIYREVGCDYSLIEYYNYVSSYNKRSKENLSIDEGIIKFLTSKLRMCKFRKQINGEYVDIFRVIED